MRKKTLHIYDKLKRLIEARRYPLWNRELRMEILLGNIFIEQKVEEQAPLRDFANKHHSPEKVFSDTDILNRIRTYPMVKRKTSW